MSETHSPALHCGCSRGLALGSPIHAPVMTKETLPKKKCQRQQPNADRLSPGHWDAGQQRLSQADTILLCVP